MTLVGVMGEELPSADVLARGVLRAGAMRSQKQSRRQASAVSRKAVDVMFGDGRCRSTAEMRVKSKSMVDGPIQELFGLGSRVCWRLPKSLSEV